MKIFDCFTYFNEEQMLKIRLHELYSCVDSFVIVEASKTFTGNSKPFYLEDIGEWINPFLDKIIKIKVDFPKDEMTSWEREYFQRNAIMDGLSFAKKNDIILISDVDEIIKSSVIQELKNIKKPVALDNRQYFWNFNWQVPDHCNQTARPVALKYSELKKNSPQKMREALLPRIPNAGWHFSYFSDINNIIYKIESFAHTEYNEDEYKSLETIKHRIENGIDPFDRFPLKYYEIDETYPVYVQNNYK